MQADKSLLFVKNKKQDHRPCFDVVRAKGLSPVRPTRWTVHWTLHFCFAKTLHFVRGSIFNPLCFLHKKMIGKNAYHIFWCEQRDLNPHGLPLDPKSSASANSAMLAYSHNTIYSTTKIKKLKAFFTIKLRFLPKLWGFNLDYFLKTIYNIVILIIINLEAKSESDYKRKYYYARPRDSKRRYSY